MSIISPERIAQIERRHADLAAQMGNPSLATDQFVQLSKDYAELTPVVTAAAAVLAKDQDKRHEAYLWGNSCYLLAQRITDAFAKYGWSAAIRGVEGGGMIEGLPVHTFNTGEGDLVMKCPTEVSITDRREKELSDLGFISLVHCKNTSYAAFFGAQSAQRARKMRDRGIDANHQIHRRHQGRGRVEIAIFRMEDNPVQRRRHGTLGRRQRQMQDMKFRFHPRQ